MRDNLMMILGMFLLMVFVTINSIQTNNLEYKLIHEANEAKKDDVFRIYLDDKLILEYVNICDDYAIRQQIRDWDYSPEYVENGVTVNAFVDVKGPFGRRFISENGRKFYCSHSVDIIRNGVLYNAFEKYPLSEGLK